MKFKVGDRVKLLPCFNSDGGSFPDGYKGTALLYITDIDTNYYYKIKGTVITRYELSSYQWAEEHEMRHLTKLEKALK